MTSTGDGEDRPAAGAEDFLPDIYEHLCALAARYQRRRPAGSLQPTSLVHEAYIRLQEAAEHSGGWRDAEHFRAVAALAMRQVLVDRARRKGADKRGGGWQRVTLTGVGEADREVDVIALDDALTRLSDSDPRQARIVVLRFFGGLTTAEISRELSVSESTVEKQWQSARAWLGALLGDDGGA